MAYAIKFAVGFNNIGSLSLLTHQPTKTFPGIRFAERDYGLSNGASDQAMYTWLPYPRISVAWFNAQNSQFGFSEFTGVITVDGTFSLPLNIATSYANFNGTIEYIVLGQSTERGFASWLDVRYVIKGLVKL